MPKVRANGIDIHYWQSGRGPHVVMSHGLGGNLAGWHLTLVPDLQKDYRITTYDLRGHGRTDSPESGYSNRNMAEDLKGVLDALGIDHAHLVGHSWGADISLQFALLYPERVRSLILVEAGLLGPLASEYRSHEWEGWDYTLASLEALLGAPIPPDKRHDLEYLLKSMMEIPVQFGPSRGRRRDQRVVDRVVEVLLPMWNGEAAEWDLTLESLRNVQQPTLLMYESGSLFHRSSELLEERLPNCRSVLLDGSHGDAKSIKHFTLMEIPEQLVSHTRAFLESQTAAIGGRRR